MSDYNAYSSQQGIRLDARIDPASDGGRILARVETENRATDAANSAPADLNSADLNSAGVGNAGTRVAGRVLTMERTGLEAESATEVDGPLVSVGLPDTESNDDVVATDRTRDAVFEILDLSVAYSGNVALAGMSLDIRECEITALIGPSGCGKSTALRCLNRMNDLISGAVVGGAVKYHGVDLYGTGVDPVEVRRRIGMVFQKPNPFPKSIFDNVAYGPRIQGQRKGLDEVVERSLTRAALWDEVKDKLKESAYALSGGQQQRLCIARTLAVEPDVILMDEPCSALDPIATARIEDLMTELKADFTIVIVTHNMQQAARVSDRTAFMTAEVDDRGDRVGRLVEIDNTRTMFTNPSDPRTEGYITGRFG